MPLPERFDLKQMGIFSGFCEEREDILFGPVETVLTSVNAIRLRVRVLTTGYPCARRTLCCRLGSYRREPSSQHRIRARFCQYTMLAQYHWTYNDNIKSSIQHSRDPCLSDNRTITLSQIMNQHAEIQMDRLLFCDLGALCISSSACINSEHDLDLRFFMLHC